MTKFKFLAAAAIAALSLTGGNALAADSKGHGYRIFISIDMEGIDGMVTPKQISGGGIDYQASRKLMTEELLAAMDGARKAGATQFVVADSHGDSQNILIEMLPEDATLVRGVPRPLEMMEGIQNGHYDGVFFLGYHASASNPKGVRAHTFASARLSEVKVNGFASSEGYFNAAVAGDFGVPVLLVTGDQSLTEELRPTLKDAEMVAVKRDVGFHSAEMLAPSKARALIQEGAARAIKHIGTATPFKVSQPVTVDMEFHFYRPAEVLSYLPSIKRVGARTIEYESKDATTAMKMVSFILGYNAELEP